MRGVSLTLAAAALVVSLLAVELPALLGWVDYRTAIGTVEQLALLQALRAGRETSRQPAPFEPRYDVREKTRDDLARYYGLTETVWPIAFRTDRRGFRNHEDFEQADVVVLGDSFVEAVMLRQEELFTTILAERLGVPVVSLSRSGWGPYNELDALRRFGLALRPRVVLWMFFEGNDLFDVRKYQQLFEVGAFERSFLRNAYLRVAESVETLRSGRKHRNLYIEGAPLPGHCTLRCDLPPCERIYFGFLAGPLSTDEEIALKRTFEVLREAAAGARRHDAIFMVAYLPVKLRVYRDRCDFDEESPAQRTPLNDLPERMRELAEAIGIGFVDLTPAMKAAASRGDLLYFPTDTHWNAAGNAVAAEVLQPAIAVALEAKQHPPTVQQR